MEHIYTIQLSSHKKICAYVMPHSPPPLFGPLIFGHFFGQNECIWLEVKIKRGRKTQPRKLTDYRLHESPEEKKVPSFASPPTLPFPRKMAPGKLPFSSLFASLHSFRDCAKGKREKFGITRARG